MPSELDKTLVLPEKLRNRLKRVYGKIVEEGEIKSHVDEKFIICVGDVVTYTLLKNGIKPDIAIVDYKTMRKNVDFEIIKKFGDAVFSVKNPAGRITQELWNTIKKSMDMNCKVRIDVDGEEDLAVIPCVFFAPIGGIVIYGMPNTGLVVLEVTEKDKKEVYDIIKEMEVYPWN